MEQSIKDWQDKYIDAYNRYKDVLSNGKDNELAYEGTRKIKKPDGTDAQKQGSVSRKMCFELTETQADIQIPMPRVMTRVVASRICQVRIRRDHIEGTFLTHAHTFLLFLLRHV